MRPVARFIDLAIDALRDHLEADLPQALRDIETEDGLTAGSLTDPVEVMAARAPADHRSILVQCFEEDWDIVDQRNGVAVVDATVLVLAKGGPDIRVNEKFMRRYMQAVMDVIVGDETLGGKVSSSLVTDGNSEAEFSGAKTRYASMQGVRIEMFQGVKKP